MFDRVSPIQDLGKASCFPGCHVTRDRKARTVTRDQRRDAQIVAGRFDVGKPSVKLVSMGTTPLSKVHGTQPVSEIQEIRNMPYR